MVLVVLVVLVVLNSVYSTGAWAEKRKRRAGSLYLRAYSLLAVYKLFQKLYSRVECSKFGAFALPKWGRYILVDKLKGGVSFSLQKETLTTLSRIQLIK